MSLRELALAAAVAPNPGGAFNLAMARLKNRGATLLALTTWLETAVVIEDADKKGASWARSSWCNAAHRLLGDANGHEAFGGDAPGHPVQSIFSDHFNVAAYIEYRSRNGESLADIMTQVREVRGDATPDERVLRRIRSSLDFLSDGDLAKMANDSRRKLKLP